MSQRQIKGTSVVFAAVAVIGLTGCGQASGGSGSGSLSSDPTTGGAPTTAPTSTSSPDPSRRMTGTPVAPGPVVSDVKARMSLRKKSGDSHPAVVKVGSGYEGATLGSGRTIVFWNLRGGSWTQDGTSTRLPSAPGSSEEPTVSGSLLPGAQHATFVVKGPFTGDNTGQALAYGHGSSGWSLIVAQPDGSLAPSGHGARKLGDLGLELDMRFTHTGLTTYSLWGPSSTASFKVQRDRPTIRRWKASGSVLHLTDSNIMTAKRTNVSIPKPIPTPPGSATLPDGTWAVKLIGVTESHGTLTLRVQPRKGHHCMAGVGVCFSPIGPRTSLTMADDASTTVLAKDRKGQQVHVTAPGWGFASVETSDQPLPLSSECTPGAPWVVRASVAKSSIPNDYALVKVKDGAAVGADSIFGAAWHQK